MPIYRSIYELHINLLKNFVNYKIMYTFKYFHYFYYFKAPHYKDSTF